MRNHYDDSRKIIKKSFQHLQRRNIKIIGRLIQYQYVRRFHKHLEKIQSSSLAAGNLGDRRILHIRTEQESLQHPGRRNAPVGRLNIFGRIADIVDDPLLFVHDLALLGKVSDFNGLAPDDRSCVRLFFSCQQTHQRRFTAAVDSHKTDTFISSKNVRKI